MELFVVALLPGLALLAAITWGIWQVLLGVRYLFMTVFGALGTVVKRVFGFLRSEAVELLHFASAGLSLCFLIPFTAGNFITGRWDRARHYGKSIEDEFASALTGAYRVVFAHPLRFVGLGAVLKGVESRLPSITETAPKTMRNMAEAMEFEGYDVVGTLKAGGSGAQLYTARPQAETLERFRRKGKPMADEVVIKSFALVNGSTLPQIIRESRALEAASRLGLIYEHDLDEDRFFYVMPYVKGDNLDVVIKRMHALSGAEGLDRRQLALALGYARDMLRSLDRFHTGGLWHKDVKPSNLIVAGEGAHLVDFGLVTPLHSALTLTTHGTEYYRDPEMVRLAMQGVKVHEVDGVKFDLYSAGAVLFSMIENSFPAHGSLSQLTKACPEALAWIVRRSMADIGSRYRGAWEMLDDLKTVSKARDPYKLRPADLPSMQRGSDAPRPEKPRVEANRFGMPQPEVVVAAHGRRSRLRDHVDERPPSLPKAGAARQSRKRKRRRSGAFGRAVLGMFAAGVILSVIILDEQGGASDVSNSHSHVEVHTSQERGGGTQKLVLSSASPSQKKDFREAQAILETVLPKRGQKGAELSSLYSGEVPNLKGRRVYILQDFSDPASELVLLDLKERLTANGFEVMSEGADQGRDAALKFLVGAEPVGDEGSLASLQSFLNAQDELAAVIWVCEGQTQGTGLYELVINGR